MKKIEILKDREAWDGIVKEFADRDIYFLHGYFVPFKNIGDGDPCLFYCQSKHGRVAYPFLVQDVAECPNLKGLIEKSKYFDISSVYGYGGPIFESSGSQDEIINLRRSFFAAFSDYCRENAIVSQFDRFHPLIRNHLFCDGYMTISQSRKTVHIDLSDPETIWKNMESRGRNMIRKAEKSGVRIHIDDNPKELDGFVKLYQQTMSRNKTADYYFFSRKFFQDTVDNLANKVLVVYAFYGDRIIAASIFLKYHGLLHYHLSGSDHQYRSFQPNSLLLYKVALYGYTNGMKTLHLGGGFESQCDSLYIFKRSFNRNGTNDFYIGKKIHDEKIYDELIRISEKTNTEEGYFPEYRA